MTSDGAKLNICVIYSSDTREESPVEYTMPIIRVQRTLTDCERFVSSPALYCLKKGAGSESTLIINAASTLTDVFVLSFCISSPLTDFMRFDTAATQIIHTVTPNNAEISPFCRIGPVNAFVMRGIIIPINVAASAVNTAVTLSDTERQFSIYILSSHLYRVFSVTRVCKSSMPHA